MLSPFIAALGLQLIKEDKLFPYPDPSEILLPLLGMSYPSLLLLPLTPTKDAGLI